MTDESTMAVCQRQECDDEAVYRVTNGCFIEVRCEEHATHDLPNTEVIGRV